MENLKANLTAAEGLLLGWCLFHNISHRAIQEEDSPARLPYEADLKKLFDWLEYRKIGDVSSMTYADYKAGVMAAIKCELEHAAHMSRVVSLDVLEVIKMSREWIGCIEAFSLVTSEEAAEIEFLGGAGSERKRQLRPKPYLPSGQRAPWVEHPEPIREVYSERGREVLS